MTSVHSSNKKGPSHSMVFEDVLEKSRNCIHHTAQYDWCPNKAINPKNVLALIITNFKTRHSLKSAIYTPGVRSCSVMFRTIPSLYHISDRAFV